MSMRGMEKLHDFLFSEGREVRNIKFFPGSNRDLTQEQLAAAAHGLLAAIVAAPRNAPPVSGLEPLPASVAFL